MCQNPNCQRTHCIVPSKFLCQVLFLIFSSSTRFRPQIYRLTADYSTIELQRIIFYFDALIVQPNFGCQPLFLIFLFLGVACYVKGFIDFQATRYLSKLILPERRLEQYHSLPECIKLEIVPDFVISLLFIIIITRSQDIFQVFSESNRNAVF